MKFLSKLALSAAVISACFGFSKVFSEENAKSRKERAEQVKRGGYLVKTGACGDCHTPLKMGKNGPEPDLSRLLSGHPESDTMPAPPKLDPKNWAWAGAATNTAFTGPWGTSYAANLTPDETTGMGIWKEDMFVRAMKTGKHFGVSRPIMPPMPWQSYSNFSTDDLRAIYAYLKTIPPIKNAVPDYKAPAQ